MTSCLHYTISITASEKEKEPRNVFLTPFLFSDILFYIKSIHICIVARTYMFMASMDHYKLGIGLFEFVISKRVTLKYTI